MRATAIIRVFVGSALLALSATALVGFDIWQDQLSGLSPDGSVHPFTWLTLRIMLIALGAPALIMLAPRTGRRLMTFIQRAADRLSDRTFLLGTLALAATLRILVIVSSPSPLVLDWGIYHRLATLWASTGEYTSGHFPTGFFPPGWPFFLSRLYLVFGTNPLAGTIANVTLGVGIVYASYLLARRVWNVTVARWTVLIVALLPSQVLFVNLLCSEILFTFLFVLTCLILVRRPRSGTRALVGPLIAGLVLGLATLVRSNTLAFPVAVLPFFLFQPTRKRTALLRWLVLSVGVILVTTPWILRNQHRLGRATISTNGGVNFYIANNVHAGVGFNDPGFSLFMPDGAQYEARNDRLGYQKGLEFIAQHPARFVARGFLKVAYMLGPEIEGFRARISASGNTGNVGGTVACAVAAQALYFVLVLLACGGILAFMRFPDYRSAGAWLMLLIIIYWLAVHFVFFGDGRFHFPLVPMLAGFAGVALADIGRRA